MKHPNIRIRTFVCSKQHCRRAGRAPDTARSQRATTSEFTLVLYIHYYNAQRTQKHFSHAFGLYCAAAQPTAKLVCCSRAAGLRLFLRTIIFPVVNCGTYFGWRTGLAFPEPTTNNTMIKVYYFAPPISDLGKCFRP